MNMSGEDTVLVTGFGPFGSHKVNASWVAVQKMLTLHEDRRRNNDSLGFKLATREVPVSYSYVKQNLDKIYADTSPSLCIHVGVSPYAIVKMERFGRNFGYFSPDVEGKVPLNGFCEEDGNIEIKTSINLESVCEKLAVADTKGVQIGISEDAGQYLCDYIYYSSLHLGKCPVVFVHVPPLDDPYSSEQLGHALLQLVCVIFKETCDLYLTQLSVENEEKVCNSNWAVYLLLTSSFSKMFSMNFTDMQKIGLGLVMFGLAFLALGVMLFFDKGLLAMGNVFFLAGIVLIIGFEKTFRFFFQSHKLKGAAFFFGGIILVLIGWPIIGMIVEAYGSFLLFGKMLPHIILVLRGLPVIGNIFMLPGIKSVVDKLSDDSQSPA